jgi:sulfatase modifying factor 1
VQERLRYRFFSAMVGASAAWRRVGGASSRIGLLFLGLTCATGCDEVAPTECIAIAPGTFRMGSPESEVGRLLDERLHSVSLTDRFCMQATEVTQEQYVDLIDTTPAQTEACGPRCPVVQVSWNDAVRYANALSEQEGLSRCYQGRERVSGRCTGYRLPSEAEWEYAARGGTTGSRYGQLDEVSWYAGNSDATPHSVGQKLPNSFGLFDMLGNASEWTGDWYDSYPEVATDPTGPAVGTLRVARGGSWTDERAVRAANRDRLDAASYAGDLGFRLARTLQ